ncbi:MAG: hypothetical protein R6U00_03200, partial [Prochlorococcaceae cyanobacterium]
ERAAHREERIGGTSRDAALDAETGNGPALPVLLDQGSRPLHVPGPIRSPAAGGRWRTGG